MDPYVFCMRESMRPRLEIKGSEGGTGGVIAKIGINFIKPEPNMAGRSWSALVVVLDVFNSLAVSNKFVGVTTQGHTFE